MKRDSLSQTKRYINAMPYIEMRVRNNMLVPLLISPNPIKDLFYLEARL